MKRDDDWTDGELLRALEMRDHLRMSAAEISLSFGRSRSAVLGIFFRIKHETDQHDLTPHLNGTMKRDWWKKGLRKQCL